MVFKQLLERLQGKSIYDGPEKREFVRLIYPPGKRPRLKIREHSFEIINISEKGMKLLNHMQRKLGKKIAGTIIFSNGNSMDITGKIAWKHDKEIGLLTTRIPQSILIEEVHNLLRKENEK